jgi:hypothetical protein
MRLASSMARMLLIAAAIASPAATRADPQKLPCIPCSVVPTAALVGGRHGALPDPAGALTFVIRDLAYNPIPNCWVWLDFTDCADTHVCDAGAPGQTLDCGGRRVSLFTDNTGTATFVLTGAGTNLGGASGPGIGCVRVYADGIPMGTITPAIADQNGAASAPGVEITDLSAILRDFGTGIYFGRSDLDHDGAVTIADLSVWLRIFGTGASSEGCAASYCP